MSDPTLPRATSEQDLSVALKAAMCLCSERGAQMTKLRRLALEELWRSEKPLGAYGLLSRMEALSDRKLTPSTVYRALDFLVEQGFVARIESRNAYVPCAHPDHTHRCVFFVCDRCSRSVEIENPALEAVIAQEAAFLDFGIAHSVIELRGVCAACRT
jgi:Fur family transcriptional regulator, zinc uptake regulator